ncbi:MAG: ABC transporter permease [Bacillota bacterium]|nr:ABC transporter permease [Bacillota bacterium]
MRNIFLVAQNILKIIFKKKSNIITVFILPVVLMLLSMKLYGETGGDLKIGVSNKDNSYISTDFVKALRMNNKFSISLIDEKDINDKVSGSKIDCALVIPEGFGDNIINGNIEKVRLISIKGEDTTMWIENFINYYIKNLNSISKAANDNKEVFNTIYNSYKNAKLNVSESKLPDESQGKGTALTSLGFLIMLIMITSNSTSSLILKEKKERTFFRIHSSPVSSKSYVAGNMVANLFNILVQVIVLIAGMNLLHINTFVPPLELILILLCFGLVAIALGIFVVSVSNSTSTAGSLTTLIIAPTCMLSGCWWPISLMPKTMQNIAKFLPQTWVLDAISKIQEGSSLEGVLINIIIILCFAAALFSFAILKLRKNNNVKNFV